MASTFSVVVSPEPFAAGCDAVVFSCHLTPAPQARSTSQQGAVVVARDCASIDSIVKVNRPRVQYEDQMLTAPLLLLEGPFYTPDQDAASRNSDASGAIQERTNREIRALQGMVNIQGVYVPRLLGTLVPWTSPFSHCDKLVLEHGGTNLRALANQQPNLYLEWQDEIASAAKRALHACHALNFTHGWLHKRNILVHWLRYHTERSPVGQSSPGQSQKKIMPQEVSAFSQIQPGDAKRHFMVGVYLIDWSKASDWSSGDAGEKRKQQEADMAELTQSLDNAKLQATSRGNSSALVRT